MIPISDPPFPKYTGGPLHGGRITASNGISTVLSKVIDVGEKAGVLVFKNKSADIDHNLTVANVVENIQAGNIR